MNEQSGEKRSAINVSALSDSELAALVPQIEKEIARRKEARTKDALQKMREIAESVGMTPEELLGLRVGTRRRRSAKRSATAVRHPDDPSKVYQGGRKPAWLKALEKEGRQPVAVAE